MRTKIIPVDYEGMTLYEIRFRRWWWPSWNVAASVSRLSDAQDFARDIQLGLIKP